ncbi:MAG: hypothetical protein UV38_C0003G0228 [candidate division TM6 bacterium GW2011_GWE2_42_60]|nr:MAG: hypothetical protein UV38_C0003G0228 [candidate division TM6 bacterium GW2011_GWE2_42_60]HBY05846.1 hypothetical protein [Candidatus Dependentiae bacterium]
MFKNNIKIVVISLFVALSLVPTELHSIHYLEVVNSRFSSVAKQSQALRSRFSNLVGRSLVGRSFDKSKSFVYKLVCEHPILTHSAVGLTVFLVTGYYSGLFSGSGDKTENTKKTQVPFYKKGVVMTKQWINKIAVLCSFSPFFDIKPSDEMKNLAEAFDTMVNKEEITEKKQKQNVVEEKKIVEKIEEKKVEQTPDEKAKADLDQLIETCAPKEELVPTRNPSCGFEDKVDAQDNYISYILFNLKKFKGKDAELKSFVNTPDWSSLSTRCDPHYPIPQKGGAGASMSFFSSMLLYHYFDALNLLLSTGAVDFTSTYGEVRNTKTNAAAELKNSFLGALLVIHKGSGKFTLDNESIEKEYARTEEDVQKNITIVLGSHGAKSFGDGDELWEKKIILSTVIPSPNKLYFSSDGTKVITESEFVKQLEDRFQKQLKK